MREFRKCSRILILCLLCVFVPLFMLSYRLKHIHDDESKDFVEDLSIIKHRTEMQTLSATEQEGNGKKEPARVVYKEDASNSYVNFSYSKDTNFEVVRDAANETDFPELNATRRYMNEGGQTGQQEGELRLSGTKSHAHRVHHPHANLMRSSTINKKVNEMQDQVLRAKLYLSFTPPNSNSHLVKELKLRIKDVERAMNRCSEATHFSKSAGQRMRVMDSLLTKASHIFPDCATMIKRLRAMTYNAEEHVRSQNNQKLFLTALGGRTISKGHHCLSMRLTADFFAMESQEWAYTYKDQLKDPYLYHFAIFSDNILACSVVVNSTVSSAREPEKIVFHIVTDSLNFPAMSMWFDSNSPEKATVHVQSIENFNWLSTKYNVTFQEEEYIDPRYSSELNHLRFYLPDIFPHLHKIVLLDHDVVVQKDLRRLWNINMRGKVNGAVQTCVKGEPSFRRMDMLVNFTDPFIANNFDRQACTWAFGMNLFDLQEWRRQNLTEVYHKYLHLGKDRPLWKSGTLPIGWITFYNQTTTIDKGWHVLGLGRDPNVMQEDIEYAAVIHFDGIMKPWLETALDEYKHLWRKHVNYDHPLLQQCNVHD